MKNIPPIFKIYLLIMAALTGLAILNWYSDSIEYLQQEKRKVQAAQEEVEQARQDAEDEIQDLRDEAEMKKLLNN